MLPSQAPGDDYPEIARELRSPKRAIGWLTLSRAATAPVINDSYTFIQSTLLSDGKRGAEARRVPSDPESRLPIAGDVNSANCVHARVVPVT